LIERCCLKEKAERKKPGRGGADYCQLPQRVNRGRRLCRREKAIRATRGDEGINEWGHGRGSKEKGTKLQGMYPKCGALGNSKDAKRKRRQIKKLFQTKASRGRRKRGGVEALRSPRENGRRILAEWEGAKELGTATVWLVVPLYGGGGGRKRS